MKTPVREFTICPKCKSTLLTAYKPDHINLGCVVRFVDCRECGFQWTAHFHIALHTNYPEGEPIDENGNPIEVEDCKSLEDPK